MLIGVMHTDAEIQSIALHFFEHLSRQFLENSTKITNQLFFKNSSDGYFKLTGDISLKSVSQQV